LDGGADLIDIKDPQRGSLGAARQTTWREVCAVVAKRRPVSVALGELLEFAPLPSGNLPAEVRYAKLGLARCALHEDWSRRWLRALETLPRHVDPVAVIYADAEAAAAPTAAEIVRQASRVGCRALLIDTFEKTSGNLLETMSREALQAVIARARLDNLIVVLGGSLDAHSLEAALQLEPDYVAFRGAVCRGRRTDSLDQLLVRELAARLAIA
jgi:uncharacterized protein (UPF0264 family)